MDSIDAIADQIITREGGYVEDKDDPGGATKFGVTLGTLQRLGMDQNADGKITNSDVQGLSHSTAHKIFVKEYFHKPRLDLLPAPLQASVFDMYVNSGTMAVRLLQGLLRDFGHKLDLDGVIGPQTVKAARIAFEKAPDHLVDAYGITRRNYYYDLADRRPSSRKYACRKNGEKGGWIKRAEEFISPRFHLSDAEHVARVAAWH
jgi:lysozyme family protein